MQLEHRFFGMFGYAWGHLSRVIYFRHRPSGYQVLEVLLEDFQMFHLLGE